LTWYTISTVYIIIINISNDNNSDLGLLKKKKGFGFIEKAQKSAPKVRFFECASLLRRKVQDHWGFKLRA
jgi:hypothetical protein